MEKQHFFDSLHKELAEKYNLLPIQVLTLRSSFIGQKNTRKQIAEWLSVKLSQPSHHPGKPSKGCRSHSKAYYQDLLNFIASCSEQTWNDINQRTKFDR